MDTPIVQDFMGTPIDEDFLKKLRPKISRLFTSYSYERFKNFVSQFKTKEEFILYCVCVDYTVVELASETSLNDEDFMNKAISGDLRAFEFASEKLKDSRDFVLDAISKTHGYVISFASERLKNDEDFLLEAAKRHGWVLQFVPEKLRNRDLCFEAVKTHGGALQFVPEELRDLDLCREAVKKHEDAKQFVPKEFLKDKDIWCAVLYHNYIYYGSVPDDLKNDEDILKILEDTKARLAKIGPFHLPRFIDDERPFWENRLSRCCN